MASDSESGDPVARADALVRLFGSATSFGAIRAVLPAAVPEPARSLLDHRSHMTVAMERFHGGDVRLRVVATAIEDAGRSRYAREILLETADGRIVQHGIVRIDLSRLDAATAKAIRDAQRPLGRILIAAGMLREVRDVRLLEVLPGAHLRELLKLSPAGLSPAGLSPAGAVASPPLYGRVADIELAGRPAVELLEIVVPAAESGRG